MTLQELFTIISDNPVYVLFFFIVIPLTAILSGIMGKREGHLSPWKYLYAVLVYAVCVPGIFSITLNIYMFLFEQKPILETDVYTQIFPIISMLVTLLIIRQNVNLDEIPGFGKLSALVMMITATLAIMWFIDRTRIYVFTYMRFEKVILIFIGLLIVIRLGWYRVLGGSKNKKES